MEVRYGMGSVSGEDPGQNKLFHLFILCTGNLWILVLNMVLYILKNSLKHVLVCVGKSVKWIIDSSLIDNFAISCTFTMQMSSQYLLNQNPE